MMITLLAASVLAAALLQTLSGFGFALIVMPLAVHLAGIQIAAPLVALVALVLYVINFIRYRQSLDLSEFKRLVILAALGAPLGVWALSTLDETLIQRGLGLLLAGYAVYALLRPARLHPISGRWAYPAGFAAGILGGAYNTPGPPLILYGSMRQQPHANFRALLQAMFLINGVIVVSSHALVRHYDPQLLTDFLMLLPALIVGIVAGAWLDRRIQPERLRTLVLALILLLGVSLVV
ncbi:MAG: sulfite exporter TauE/SafE family protein [Caldilineales bacterium]|nr:sulfite exporter TauE/SafE family protein [Caldilineales bacterium]